MDLMTYAERLEAKLVDFLAFWKHHMKEFPANFPTEMSEEEWEEQFSEYLSSEGKCFSEGCTRCAA